MTTGPTPDTPPDSGGPPTPAAQSTVPSTGQPSRGGVLTGSQVITEVITLVLCGPLAAILVVMVAVHGWQPWWLITAGMVLAWAGDAAWALGEHTAVVVLARRKATTHPAGGVDHPSWREGGPQAGDHR